MCPVTTDLSQLLRRNVGAWRVCQAPGSGRIRHRKFAPNGLRGRVDVEGPSVASFPYPLGRFPFTFTDLALELNVTSAGSPHLNVGCAGCAKAIIKSQIRHSIDRIDDHKHKLIPHHQSVFDPAKRRSELDL